MSKYSLLVIDFETAFDAEYSLSKMTTDAYILDKRFSMFGCGVIHEPTFNSHKARWLSVLEMYHFFASIDWDHTVVLAHNTAFDGFILRHICGYKPKMWLDTLSMARALIGVNVGGSLAKVAKHYELGEKGNELVNMRGVRYPTKDQLDALGRYCCNDTELCLAAYEKMRPHFPSSEMQLIDLTLRMFIEPIVRFNQPKLQTYADDERARKQALLDRISATPKVLRSSNKFAEMLFLFGVDPPRKKSPTTGADVWAFAKTDEGFLDLLNHEEEPIRWLAEARLAVSSNINETRTQRFIDVGERPWPVLLNYYGAYVSGRWSGGNKQNPQNLQRGGVLRDSIEPPPGYVHVVCDSSQIEARLLAYIARQDDLVELFRQGGDPYCRQASALYHREITKADELERHVGKVLTLACGYGMSAPKFRRTLKLQTGIDMSAYQADTAVQTYRTLNKNIVRLWNAMDRWLRRGMAGMEYHHPLGFSVTPDGIVLPNSMVIKYPGLRQTPEGMEYYTVKGPVKLYSSKSVENLIQGLARIVVAEQMLQIDKVVRGMGGQVWLMAHDEVCSVVPEQHAEEAASAVLAIMRTPPKWAVNLPVNAEVGIGLTYGEAKK